MKSISNVVSASSSIGLIIAIILALNLVAHEFYLRLDLTEGKQYTLSEATRNILEELEQPVTVKAYFSENIPPHIAKTRQDFRDILVEYANRANGQLLYEFVNPNEKDSYEKEATEKGIQPVVINVREKDQVKQQKAFLGAVVELGERTEVIPFIQPGAAMEYALSTAIKKISIEDKPVIGFIQGHGEPSMMEMPQALQELNVLYESQAVTMTDSTVIPENIKTLALIRPMDSVPASHLKQLDTFLSRGGRLFVAINRVSGNLQSMYGGGNFTGLESWLQQKGITINENFVVDAKCGSVSVPQQLGVFTIQTNVSFPFVPVISTFADHPITSGLESMLLEFASEIQFTGDSSFRFTPIAFTSELSNALPAPQFFDLNKEWSENDLTRQHIPVAVAVESASESNPYRMVIVSDGDFVVNGPYQQQRRQQPDNIHLLSNSIDWLSDDTGLIALRTKGVISRPIRELDDTTKTLLKYGNFLLPLLLVIGYGLIRQQRNRIKRLKRMNDQYEIA